MTKKLIVSIALISVSVFSYAEYCPNANSINCNASDCTVYASNFKMVKYIKPYNNNYDVSFYQATGPCADGASCNRSNNQISGAYCSYWVGDGMVSIVWDKTNYQHNYVDTNRWKKSNGWLSCVDGVNACYWQPNA